MNSHKKIEIVVPPKEMAIPRKMNIGLNGEMTERVNKINDPVNDNLINRLKVLCEKFNYLPDLDEVETREELNKYKPFLGELGDIANGLMEIYEECGELWDDKRKEIEGSWS